jgi:hypothetical protein
MLANYLEINPSTLQFKHLLFFGVNSPEVGISAYFESLIREGEVA